MSGTEHVHQVYGITTLCSEKTPTHSFSHISMNDVSILTKIAVNIPKEW